MTPDLASLQPGIRSKDCGFQELSVVSYWLSENCHNPTAILIIHLTGSLTSIKGSTRPMLPRSLLTVACNLTYYLAIAALPLATVGALYLSAPLMITALSVLLLQEKVNAVQWGAVAAGFVGVVLIIHPGYGVFEWAMVLPLLSALSYAGAVIFVRKAGGESDSGVMSLQSQAWLSVTGLALGLLLGFGQLRGDVAMHPSMSFLLSGWQWPSARDALVLLLCGVVGSASTYFLTRAYSLSDASRLAPFEYTALLWSIFLGWLVWGHLPAAKDWAGIALLVCAGLVSVYAAGKPTPEAPQAA
jgi:drug/metabolite transporter (DMT)-like permease